MHMNQLGQAVQNRPAFVQEERVSGLTEMILAQSQDLSMILPSLAYLTNQHKDRWLTWISHSPKIDRRQLEHYGFNLKHLRIIHVKDAEHAFWLFWEALTEGNSHTVIATIDGLDARQTTQLERAAHVGACVGLLLKSRHTPAH